ncbi:protein DpdH [Stagnihabitans tardus]|uniref:ATP-binding protein n=1 Tax=Stagnihabitans tardus TaxID=2699202 RepID=A0AAE4YE17_9RHOB|nr:protein DpdH [Stagnihabitans tardus]NBZ89651.1 hypothetical protein [Stagnihabitans tardus]
MVIQYWPDANAVNSCIKNEAETAEDAVLLAAHQPMRILRRAEGSATTERVTEQDILDAFTTDNVPGGYVLMPITGVSGAGKSHVIRWLDAQLQRSEKRDRYHIIRIPKSASLRTVVELILEPLKGNPKYAKPWQDLTRAVAEVNIATAVVTFRAHLENALKARGEELRANFTQGSNSIQDKQLIGFAGDLPKLFSDAALEEHFNPILARVVARALNGRNGEVETADTLSRFQLDDLRLPDTVDINRAAQRVRDFYLRNISHFDPKRLEPALKLLNDAVDPAVSNVFQLEQSTGGVTLQEIILSVREILFSEGKDLVLLVEDFAALAGLQDVLLKVSIQEGEYEGKKVRATMRTALALTDGYLSFRDTILTRARQEWIVDGKFQSDDEVKAAVIELVGGYLNAARWGAEELNRLFRQRGAEKSLTDWLPVWRDEGASEKDSETIAAFGETEGGIPLFPFNRSVIEAFSVRILAQSDKLEFNPRRVINQIIREILLMRPAFEAREFPPEFQGHKPNASLAAWLKQQHLPENKARRMASLLTLWGGNPPDTSGIGDIPIAVFSAFDLPSPKDLGVSAPRSDRTKPEPFAQIASTVRPVLRTETPVTPKTESARIAEVRAKLEEWANGIELRQDISNELRKNLMSLCLDAIDLPELRLRQSSTAFQAITSHQAIGIPQSRGNGSAKYPIADDASDPDGSLRAGLLAVFRYAENGRNWNYPEADEDYIRSAALVDHLVSQIKSDLLQSATKQLYLTCNALIVQSRVVGLEPAIRISKPEDLLYALLEMPKPRESQSFDVRWDKLQSAMSGTINGKSARLRLQEALVERCAAYQGTGQKPFLVDIVRLLDANCETSVAPEMADQLGPEIKQLLRELVETTLSNSLTSALTKLREFKENVAVDLGEDFDKAAFVSDMTRICAKVVETGLQVNLPIGLPEYQRRLAEFAQSPVKNLMDSVERVLNAEKDQIPKALNAMGTLDLGLIARFKGFVDYTGSFLKAIEIAASREEANRQLIDPKIPAQEISRHLSELAGAGIEEVEK